jgi:hypothetical protein
MPPERSSLARAEAPAALINGLGGKAPWPFSPAPRPRQTRSGTGTDTGKDRPFRRGFRYKAKSYGK